MLQGLALRRLAFALTRPELTAPEPFASRQPSPAVGLPLARRQRSSLFRKARARRCPSRRERFFRALSPPAIREQADSTAAHRFPLPDTAGSSPVLLRDRSGCNGSASSRSVATRAHPPCRAFS